jgi:hypothetical protein
MGHLRLQQEFSTVGCRMVQTKGKYNAQAQILAGIDFRHNVYRVYFVLVVGRIRRLTADRI